MKFCQRLRRQKEDIFDDEACSQILDYKRLKKAISTLKARIVEEGLDEEAIAAGVQEWLEDFEEEAHKFDSYFQGEIAVCEDEAAAFEQNLNSTQCTSKNALKEAYLSLQELKFFVELNKEATRKILKKMDKNVPGHNTMQWREDVGPTLLSFQDTTLQQLIQRLTSVYAALYHSNRAKLAEMELDYYVSCVSDLFSYMIENEPAGKQDNDDEAEDDTAVLEDEDRGDDVHSDQPVGDQASADQASA
eukprot:TRINITY_DN27330_c0_g1_i1.p2 TRINITY_DN27330_c0_g1~~TRINITY_DN27330_c0_g1_i1.p2  ORF type:complete len:247 (+),score=119.01 TRINITY_DN27330_c0_g1_i1:77-817(+)